MPLKDREARRAYMREWYARPENRERVIKKVHERKWDSKKGYGGTCRNCGRPTMGNTKGKAAEFCGRPECKSVQHKLHWEVFSAAGKKPHLSRKQKARRRLREKEVVSIDDLTQAY